MLVLSRKVGECIVIADGLITLKVVEIDRNKVRLGFVAPTDIGILREELIQNRIETHNSDVDVIFPP